MNHSYLAISFLGFGITLLFYRFSPGTRKMMALSGTAFIPFSLMSFLHEKTYWNPHRLNGMSWGVEDILFTFSVGSLVWFFAEKPFQLILSNDGSLKAFLSRLGAIGIPAVGGTFILTQIIGAMTATILGHCAVLAYLLKKKPYLLLLALSAILCYPLYYFCVLNIFSFWLDPNFSSLWNGTDIWGMYFLGIPLEEYLWVTSFSASWALLIAHATDTRIVGYARKPQPEGPLIDGDASPL